MTQGEFSFLETLKLSEHFEIAEVRRAAVRSGVVPPGGQGAGGHPPAHGEGEERRYRSPTRHWLTCPPATPVASVTSQARGHTHGLTSTAQRRLSVPTSGQSPGSRPKKPQERRSRLTSCSSRAERPTSRVLRSDAWRPCASALPPLCPDRTTTGGHRGAREGTGLATQHQTPGEPARGPWGARGPGAEAGRAEWALGPAAVPSGSWSRDCLTPTRSCGNQGTRVAFSWFP